jgi:hypothetical protein
MPKRSNPFVISETVQPANTQLSIFHSFRGATPPKRNRLWEKEHQSQKVVYRGVDPKLAFRVKSIAANLRVPEGKVACIMIEFALRSYEHGDLDLHPRPHPTRMRMTLFQISDSMRLYGKPVKVSKRKNSGALWRVITTWRGFPFELKKELAVLASTDGLNVPIGELITALLRFGLKAYDLGVLNLEADQKETTFRLTREGKK